jgi:hypothetical protein
MEIVMMIRFRKIRWVALSTLLLMPLPTFGFDQVGSGIDVSDGTLTGPDPLGGIVVGNPADLVISPNFPEEYAANYLDPRDVVHSFQAEAGEWVDCVDLYAQPALKRPGMEGHQIQMLPDALPLEPKSYPDAEDVVGLNPQSDSDGDGVVDGEDNCPLVPNAGALSCDTDQDGIGNACDGDFNGDGTTSASDFISHFLPDFKTGRDSGHGTDMNCDGSLNASDFTEHFIDNFMAGKPGPRTLDDPTRYQGEDAVATLDLGADGLGCPVNSVPLRRYTLEDLARFDTLDDFRNRLPKSVREKAEREAAAGSDIEPPADGPTSLHQYAHAEQHVSNWGAESILNLWRPYTERSDEFSLSQIWVVRGSGENRDTVEAGWQKYRDLYGDWRSRLFTYFTPDNYAAGGDGCYNLTCGAFVQVNHSVYIGGAFTNYSTHGGTQYAIKLLWYKDGTNGHWWLRYGDTWVGYYPRSLFDSNGLRNHAAEVDFGGEIINRDIGSQHTRTDMGSGYMPGYGWRWAAYQRAIRYVDTSNYYRQASGLTSSRSDANCYDITQHSSTGSWERYFYFGGWGYNGSCE